MDSRADAAHLHLPRRHPATNASHTDAHRRNRAAYAAHSDAPHRHPATNASHTDARRRHPATNAAHSDAPHRHPAMNATHTDARRRHPAAYAAHSDAPHRHPATNAAHSGTPRRHPATYATHSATYAAHSCAPRRHPATYATHSATYAAQSGRGGAGRRIDLHPHGQRTWKRNAERGESEPSIRTGILPPDSTGYSGHVLGDANWRVAVGAPSCAAEGSARRPTTARTASATTIRFIEGITACAFLAGVTPTRRER